MSNPETQLIRDDIQRMRAENESVRRETTEIVRKAFLENEKRFIFKELKNTERNHKLLDTYFPPETGILTFAAFRNLLTSNPELQSKFEWRTNTPFGEYLEKEKERGDVEAQGYRVFGEVCQLLGASGIADVAINQANWSLVKHHLNNLPATAANITKVLTEQKGFAANRGNEVAVWKRDKELRERTRLCRAIASDYSLDSDAQGQCFQKYMTSPNETLETLRAKVQEIELRRGYRAMPKESLAAVAKAQTQQRSEAVTHKLPADITPAVIRSWSGPKFRQMANFYGFDELNDRLRGIA